MLDTLCSFLYLADDIIISVVVDNNIHFFKKIFARIVGA